MSNNYIFSSTDVLKEFDGLRLHKTLNYVYKNHKTMNEQKCVNYFDIDIPAKNFQDAKGYQLCSVDITNKLNELNPKVASYEEQNFHILVQPCDDSEFSQNPETKEYTYSEGQNYSRYNNYGVRCIKMIPEEDKYYLYFKADSLPNADITVRLLCIYSPEMDGGELEPKMDGGESEDVNN